MGSFQDLLLHHLAPGAGVFVALAMFCSPLFAVQNVIRTESLGDLNPLPALLGMFNCAGWIGYSLTNGDLYVFFANGPGFLIGAYLVLGMYPFAARKQRNLLSALFLAFSGLIIGVSIAGVKMLQNGDMNLPGLQTLWGLTANAILVCYYAAPLSTLWTVLVKRDSSTIYAPLTMTAMLNSSLWIAYGLAVRDYFISVPNAVGFVFASIQLGLRFTFPHHENNGDAMRDSEEGMGGPGGPGGERKRLLDGRLLSAPAAAAD